MFMFFYLETWVFNQRTYRNMKMIWPMSKGQTAARKRKDSAPFYSWLDAEWSKCYWSLSASLTERNVYYIISYINPIINKLSIKNNFDLPKEPPPPKKTDAPKSWFPLGEINSNHLQQSHATTRATPWSCLLQRAAGQAFGLWPRWNGLSEGVGIGHDPKRSEKCLLVKPKAWWTSGCILRYSEVFHKNQGQSWRE